MIRTVMAAALATLMAIPAAAEGEFAEGSEIKGWKNLSGRENAKFTARVVDVLCELTGECAEKCGDGRRQMGLVREDDGKLLREAASNHLLIHGRRLHHLRCSIYQSYTSLPRPSTIFIQV